MEDTTDPITMDTGTVRDRPRMRLLPQDQTLMLTLMLMAGVSYSYSPFTRFMIIGLTSPGYYGGYYRPYYHGYWYGKRQAEDEPAASGPNPDADAHGWGELVFMFYSIMVM